MAAANSITFRPDSSNEDYWGGWLSGITDGEGCFILAWENSTKSRRDGKPKDRGTAMFRIALRSDDHRTLGKIQALFGCGWINGAKRNISTENAKPTTLFSVSRAADLHQIVVPIFERFPLQSKKANDFAIWKRGVRILYEVSLRARVRLEAPGGFMPRWTTKDKADFKILMFALKDQREYREKPLEV